MANVRNKNVDSNSLADDGKTALVVPSSQQAEYPLLKPITFTNVMNDDYLESGVWNLK